MKIISGSLKGRNIPFTPAKFRNAETTPQKIKEALFSILGETLEEKSFLDLYGCSGQIGLEALSRGAALTVINESDTRRFRFLAGLAESWNLSKRLLLVNMPASRCLKLLRTRGLFFDYVYLDPPYPRENETFFYRKAIEEVGQSGLTGQDTVLIVQHRDGVVPPEKAGDCRCTRTRKYGSNALSCYEFIDGETSPPRQRE